MKKLWYKLVLWWKRKTANPPCPTLDYKTINAMYDKAMKESGGEKPDIYSPKDFISTRPKDSGSRFF